MEEKVQVTARFSVKQNNNFHHIHFYVQVETHGDLYSTDFMLLLCAASGKEYPLQPLEHAVLID